MKQLSKEEQTKIFYNRRMVGKRVFVITDGGWYGQVIGVKDGETILVDDNVQVSIWDVRNIE